MESKEYRPVKLRCFFEHAYAVFASHFLFVIFLILTSCSGIVYDIAGAPRGPVPTISYQDSSGKNGVKGSSMNVAPTTILSGNSEPIMNCQSSPALPAGLTLSASDCTIRGIPTVAISSTAFTIAATNSVPNTSTAIVVLQINDVLVDDSASDYMGFNSGSHLGTTYDASKLLLDSSGTPTNNSELDSSWAPQWSSLLAYWKLNNNWNDSIASANATATNGATFSTASKIGSHAASFDGVDDYARVAAAVAPNPGSTMTVSFWMKSTATAASYARLLFKADEVSLGWRIYRNNDGQKIKVVIDTSASFNQDHNSTGAFAFDGNYHHIALTLNSGSAVLYIDGAVDSSWIYFPGAGVSSAADLLFSPSGSASMFNGKLDDVAIWSTVLSDSQVKTIYERQAPNYSGQYTSRIFDYIDSNTWDGFKWSSTLPFGKELTGDANSDNSISAADSETSADYSALVGSTGAINDDNLMNSLAGLWHFNETALNAAPAGKDFSDDSGNGVHLTDNGDIEVSQNGKLSNAVFFDGTNDSISFPGTFNPWANDFSFSFWATHETCASNQNLFIYNEVFGVNGFRFGLEPYGGNAPPCFWQLWSSQSGGSVWVHSQSSSLSTYKWNHITLTFHRIDASSGTATLYIDGESVSVDTGNMIAPPAGGLLGAGSGTGLFKGKLDELAIWARALDAKEVRQLYRRGGSRVKYQVRSCSDSSCSGVNWQGPDGTNQSYFSELQNNTLLDAVGAALGKVKTILPDLSFLDFSSMSALAERYFQYRSVLESDGLCDIDNDGSVDDICTPDLSRVEAVP